MPSRSLCASPELAARKKRRARRCGQPLMKPVEIGALSRVLRNDTLPLGPIDSSWFGLTAPNARQAC